MKAFVLTILFFLSTISLLAQDIPPAPADTLISDSTITMPDSLQMQSLTDSLFEGQPVIEQLPPLPPPVVMADSLAQYFIPAWQTFDIQDIDLYPRNAAGFVYNSASYFSQEYYETPGRTTVTPFGLPGGQLQVSSGNNLLRPYDRTIPVDGMIDYNDIATGDIARAGLIEGPLSTYIASDGATGLLYLEPFAVPDGPATSQFIVERGAFGYAYTRGRFARKFNEKLGMSFSTDYRNGDGFRLNTDDNAYYVKSRVALKPHRKLTLDVFINVYRRAGSFPVMPDSGGFVYNRFRRDQQLIVSATRQEFFGGQLTGTFDYQSSRSDYTSYSTPFFRNIKPRFYNFDLSYLKQTEGSVYEIAIAVGKDKYTINQAELKRETAALTFSALRGAAGGKLFAVARIKNSDLDHPGYDVALGFSRAITERLKSIISLGHTTTMPDPVERYAPARVGIIGSVGSLSQQFMERGNPGLQPARALTGNATIVYGFAKGEFALSVNGGQMTDAIYYDRRFKSPYPAGEVYAANDDHKFIDANVSARLNDIGPFFAVASATLRKIDSDRYGNRPPYSPRWQTYGQMGLKHYVSKYDIYVRAFGDITYYERPLSYQLEELNTAAMITWGVNASMQSFTFYYQMHNALNQYNDTPEGYGYTGWYYSWGINWKFLD